MRLNLYAKVTYNFRFYTKVNNLYSIFLIFIPPLMNKNINLDLQIYSNFSNVIDILTSFYCYY